MFEPNYDDKDIYRHVDHISDKGKLLPMYEKMPRIVAHMVFVLIYHLGVMSEWFLRIGRPNMNDDANFLGTYTLRNYLENTFTILQGFYIYTIIYIMFLSLTFITVYLNVRSNPTFKKIVEKTVETYLSYIMLYTIGIYMCLRGFSRWAIGYSPQYAYRGFFNISYPHDFIMFLMIGLIFAIFIIYVVSYVRDEILYKNALFSTHSKKEKIFKIVLSGVILVFLIYLKWTS